jgi:hypothetical protein
MKFMENGGEHLQNLIDCAINKGEREIVIKGNYDIEKAIVLPSNFTVILRDCHLRQKDGAFCNIFTNTATVNSERTIANRDHNIKIIGKGNAVLDGGNFNGLTERNYKEKKIPMYLNHLIFFSNLENFSVQGIRLINQRYWAINITFCSNGCLKDLDFCADDGILYVDGERDYNIGYGDFCIKHLDMLRNADGIDIRLGCHDILIENITGFTEDDLVAITGLCGKTPNPFVVQGLSTDIHDVTVRSVKGCSWCAVVRLLNQGGINLYNIVVDTVEDTSQNSEHMNRGLYGVRVGDSHLYGVKYPEIGETRNIVIKNVRSRAETVVNLESNIIDCIVENVEGFDGFTTKILNNATLYGNSKIQE